MKKIAIHGGDRCPKCNEPMQRFEHSPDWRPRPGRSFYHFWDLCRPCGHLQHYGHAHEKSALKADRPLRRDADDLFED